MGDGVYNQIVIEDRDGDLSIQADGEWTFENMCIAVCGMVATLSKVSGLSQTRIFKMLEYLAKSEAKPMSNPIHIGAEAKRMLETGRTFLNAAYVDEETDEAAYEAFNVASVNLGEKINVGATYLRDFVWSMIGRTGIKADVTAEEIVKILQFLGREVEL